MYKVVLQPRRAPKLVNHPLCRCLDLELVCDRIVCSPLVAWSGSGKLGLGSCGFRVYERSS